jgi:branched-chain amino acid transport system substrate-binding protein
MKRTSHVILALVLIASLALAACQPAAPKVIKIATQSPLSGGQSVLGVDIKNGAELALEQLGGPLRDMGFTVTLAPYDDQANPDTGVANAKQIVADPAILCGVGHLNSGVMIPSSEEYHTAGLAFVSPANTNPLVTDRGYLEVNRIVGRDDLQGPVGAEFAATIGSSVYILHDKTAYGQGLADFVKSRAEELGATVVSFVGTEEGSNFQPLIIQMRAQRPDLVYYGGIYDKGAVLLKQMRERGITATFMGGDGLDGADYVRIGGKAVIGSVYTTTAGPISTLPRTAEAAKAYKAKFGKDTESYGMYAYDAANVILIAMENAIKANGGKKPTRDQVTAEVRKVTLKGITGDIAFDSKGDRTLSDYYVIYMKAADYATGPQIQKIIRFAPPKK